MPWLIDAANLGGALGGAAGARNTKAILAALLPWARERPQVVVVFDGPEPTNFARQLGGVEIVWSGTRSADEVIAKRLAAIAAIAGKAAAATSAPKSSRRPSSPSAPLSRSRNPEPRAAPRPPLTSRRRTPAT